MLQHKTVELLYYMEGLHVRVKRGAELISEPPSPALSWQRSFTNRGLVITVEPTRTYTRPALGRPETALQSGLQDHL